MEGAHARVGARLRDLQEARQQEAARLAGACLGNGHQVAPLQRDGPRLRLDGRRRLVARPSDLPARTRTAQARSVRGAGWRRGARGGRWAPRGRGSPAGGRARMVHASSTRPRARPPAKAEARCARALPWEAPRGAPPTAQRLAARSAMPCARSGRQHYTRLRRRRPRL